MRKIDAAGEKIRPTKIDYLKNLIKFKKVLQTSYFLSFYIHKIEPYDNFMLSIFFDSPGELGCGYFGRVKCPSHW